MVKRRIHRIGILLLFGLLVVSCRLEQEIDFDFPEGEEIPIVEALLVQGEPYQLSFSRSNTLYEDVKLNPVWNAEVRIVADGDSIRMRNIFRMDEDGGNVYNYIHDSLVGTTCEKLELLIRDDTYGFIRSSCRCVPEVEIRACSLDVEGVLHVVSENVGDAWFNYYLLRMSAYDSGKIAMSEELELDFYDVPEGNIDIYYPLALEVYDSIDVELYRIDSSVYVYQRSIWNALSANIDPYTTPSPFFGNVEGAWGVFGAASYARSVIER